MKVAPVHGMITQLAHIQAIGMTKTRAWAISVVMPRRLALGILKLQMPGNNSKRISKLWDRHQVKYRVQWFILILLT